MKSIYKKPVQGRFYKFSLLLSSLLLISGLYLHHYHSGRFYKSTLKIADKEEDGGSDAIGMEQFFFDARKNPLTGQMDYGAMLKTAQDIKLREATHRAASGSLGLSWQSLGPTNVGGRTRAILFDKNDPSGNTIFAAAVSGGIWKSTNGGASWNLVNDNLPSLEACCLAQDSRGHIYCGTGEGFSDYFWGDGVSTAMIGGGIFVSTDDGATFNVLPSTAPVGNSNIQSNINTDWAYVNRIAIPPCQVNVIYAATNAGLFISGDTGHTWQKAKNSVTNNVINGQALDVKVSADGSVVIASIGGQGYIQNPPSCGSYDIVFTNVNQGKLTGKLGTGQRIEFAISPTNSQYIYASVATGGGSVQGVYMTNNQGGHWYDIGPGGAPAFNPFSVGGGASDQGDYDNVVSVFPDYPTEILLGGTTLWFWKENFPNDTVGSWQNISIYSAFPGYPYYIHPDEHAISFDPANHNSVFIGCDGGIYQSINVNNLNNRPSSFPTWNPMNRNYDATQFYSIAFAPFQLPGSGNGDGILGGTQDNGTPYVSGLVNSYPQDEAMDMSGGDGGGAAISYINPNIFFTTFHYAPEFLRGGNLHSVAFPVNMFTNTKGLNKGGNIDSVASLGNGGQGSAFFVPAIALYENMYDNHTIDSIRWIADKSYQAGDTVYPVSPNGNIPIRFLLPRSVSKGDSVILQNTVVSKVAIGFSGMYGVWICMQAADVADPAVWMPIGGSLSKPDAFNDNGMQGVQVHCMNWSPDGDALFVGTEDGRLWRFSNLDSIRDTSYRTGALWSERIPEDVGGAGISANPLCRVLAYKIDTQAANPILGHDILSVTINPYNGNLAIVTVGGYDTINLPHVFYSSNALSVHPLPSWKPKQGFGATALPDMPVYSSAFALQNGSPTPNAVVVGTEHGVWSTPDITVANPQWTEDNSGAPNTLVLALHQQNAPTWLCDNSGNLYMGTHGRGAWRSGTLGALGVPTITPATAGKDNLKVYPNPMVAGGTVDFQLTGEDNLVLTIYDLQGKIVKNESLGRQIAGEHLIPIETSEYSAGTYIVSLTGSSFRQYARIVVVK